MSAAAFASHLVRTLDVGTELVPETLDQGVVEMKRKGMSMGLLGLGLAGALVGGAGIAAAATGPSGPAPGLARTSTAMLCDGTGMSGTHSGVAFGRDTAIPAAASYLGVTQTELRTQLQSGKTLAEVATAQGKSVSGLEAAIVTSLQAKVNADTGLTAQQKATILAQLNERVTAMVQATHHAGAGLGTMRGRMGAMGR